MLYVHVQEVQELRDLERTFFTFLHMIAQHGFSSIFLSSESSHLLNDIIQSIMLALYEHKDALVRKVC